MRNNDIEISEMMLKYEFAKETLMTEINILIKENEFYNKVNPVEHIKYRIKSRESAINKLRKKGHEVNAKNLKEHVHDMVGARIVCSFISDVYDIKNIIENSKLFKIKEEKDYIKKPKESGYRSYHINILVPIHLNEKIEYIESEIQIRTVAMDFFASLDHKMRYKFENDIPESIKKQMTDFSKSITDIDEKMFRLNEIINNNYK